MADEDTQVPFDASDDTGDEKPVNALMHSKSVDGASSDDPHGADVKDGATVSPSKKWKREVLSPRNEAESTSKPSKPEAEPVDPHSPVTKTALKAAKRIKTREDSRKANDLLECFHARASSASTSSESMKKPAAASTSDLCIS